MKIAIVGGRDFNDYELVKSTMRKHFRPSQVEAIVSGGAKGADALAERLAKEYNIKPMIFPADWDKYGKAAGYIRNKDIVKNSDVVIAFWDGKSSGTKHSIDLAGEYNKKLLIVNY